VGEVMKRKVLVLAGYYVPSVKGGGPIQSIKNLVDNLSDRIEFYILAADRDLGDHQQFQGVVTNKWVQVGNAKVFYININELSLRNLAGIINSVSCDVIYLNSFFSYKFSIAALLLSKLTLIPQKPLILAPRGQFNAGALGLKTGKKRLFITIIKAFGLYNGIKWHATAEAEKHDLEAVFGKEADIQIAGNLTADYSFLKYNKSITKNAGELKVVFISRIHPKKNLKKAIELLKDVKGKIEFNIYGPLEDKDYWAECRQTINILPESITVTYRGFIDHEDIMEVFNDHHVFLFPTLGENYGHVISEAFIGGCPVIISDQTPWRGLEELNVGWDLALSNDTGFIRALQYCTDLKKDGYDILSRSAFEYGKKMSNSNMDIENMYELLLADVK
jgi:glycosyltransferase involved in cell wall biosynthesis